MDPHQEAMREAALRLGVEANVLSWRSDLLRLEHGGRLVELRDGRRPSFLSAKVEALCDDKAACKARLASLGIPVPAGIVVDRAAPNQAAIEAQLARGVPQVVKPIAGTHGEHVKVGVRRLEEVLAHVAATPPGHDALVLEDEVEGIDLRLQAVGGALVAACIREPAYVVGTGAGSVRSLVEARRAEMRRQNPENRLELDDEARELLAAQGLTEDAIPELGRKVRLRRTANIAQGAIAIDVTDLVHPRYADWVARIARALPIELFAIDVRTPSLDADPERVARVLELNARPEWLHHTFSERRTHDVPALILESLFGKLA